MQSLNCRQFLVVQNSLNYVDLIQYMINNKLSFIIIHSLVKLIVDSCCETIVWLNLLATKIKYVFLLN